MRKFSYNFQLLIVWVVSSAAILALISLVTFPVVEQRASHELRMEAQAALNLRAEALRGWLGRFQSLPLIYARDKDVVAALRTPEDTDALQQLNARFAGWNDATGASDTYLLDAEGLTIAASNWDKQVTFIGRNYSFRPYFTHAMEGRLGRLFARGTASKKRGYYFSYPVRDAGEIIGVVVVKVPVDQIEEDLAAGPHAFFVTDARSVIVLSGTPEWRMTHLDLHPLDEREALHVTRPMGIEGWTIHSLAPAKMVRWRAYMTTALFCLSALVALLVLFLLAQRRRRYLMQLEARKAAQQRLELSVAERTRDLQLSNEALAQEVEERRSAEMELRRTQLELIQAGKLAALGQMSTSLSHEFNQPLAAIRAYADNASAFLGLGRVDDADENLERISALTERMAELSKNLNAFARKPGLKVGPVDVASALSQAAQLLQGRLDQAGVELELPRPTSLRVMGGRNRLQQVLINLMANAIDACAQEPAPKIRIEAYEREDGDVALVVSDNGPGVPPELLERIFDPFFSTKEAGEGLGLGLSITFNIVRDFGGSIHARNTPKGAQFEVRLPNGAGEIGAEAAE